MFGKLTLNSIPFHEPIIMVTVGVIIVVGLLLLAALTYYKKWTWLWTEWLTTTDHKRIGIMYIFIAIVMLVRGFADAIMMRLQMALASSGSSAGYLPPEHYDQIFTAHGVIMIFFMATPFIIGLMNIVVPLQIGARDVAFPLLNSVSFWFTIAGIILINISLGVGEFAKTGWLSYVPLSGKQYSPGVGVDYWIWSLQLSGLGTMLSGINFIATIFRMRAPGMTLMRMPIFTWTSLCSNILIVATFPILTATIILLTLDRYLGFHLFTNDLGGNQMMYVNLVWAWGHPEVYILILPAFGVYSEVVATFSRKRLFGYATFVWATAVITILSLVVWLHHFFTMGSGPNVNAFFGIATMIISIPTGVKIFNWLFTMYRGRIEFASPMLWMLGFFTTFTIGGMTGVLLAIPAFNFVVHNSQFVVAHFHNVIIGGVVFGVMAGYQYWFPKVFGFKLNEVLGKCIFFLWFFGFIIAFAPIYILGFMGMPRRVSQDIDTAFHPMLVVACIGGALIFLGIILTVVQILVSIKQRKQNLDLTGDPWNGRTLEWAMSSPPPSYNFAVVPKIHDIDAFWDMKQDGSAYRRQAHYEPIHMPKNTAAGVIIGLISAVLGFGLVWHIWWLVIVALIAIFVVWVRDSFDYDKFYYVSSEQIAKDVDEHLANLKKAGVIHGN